MHKFCHLFIVLSFIVLTGCESLQQKNTNIEEPDVVYPEWLVFENNNHCYPVDKAVEDSSQTIIDFPLSPDDSLWPRLQSGLTFNYVDKKSVKQQLNWYVKHPDYMERVQKRASRYLYFIMTELHEEDAPFDIAFLPIVESAYEPFAYSHGQASGLWQFIPGTGKRFKLQQNWWFDGRRDAAQSTVAAIKYLKYLHRYFDGDWLLAVAAYNSGEGTVRKAIRKNKKKGKPTDFWHLDLPKETRAYVPKMIALVEIFRNPQKYNINLVSIPNKPYFDEVTLDSQLDLSQAASLANISMEEIYYLNSGLNRWATPPKGKYNLKLPVDSIAQFNTALAELPKSKRVTWHRHTIKSGESLSVIAKNYKSDKQLIKDINKMRSDRIVAGKTLMIPVASANNKAYVKSESQRLSKRQNSKPKSGTRKINYYVQSGDSFWKIAKNHKVSTQSLAKWNNKSPKDTLKIGQKLVIWTSSTTLAKQSGRSPKITKLNYKVRKGDSLAKVASKFNLKIPQIINWNNINPAKYLQPGQALTLFVNVMDTY